MTDNERIDVLCQYTRSPTVLNALHLCREGTAIGADSGWKWRNANALVSQHPIEFLQCPHREWLQLMAENETPTTREAIDALRVAERFIRGFEDDELQEGIPVLLGLIRDILRRSGA
jgi:hypothetical protein